MGDEQTAANETFGTFPMYRYTVRPLKDEWREEELETFREKERESGHLKHFFMGNRLEVVINSNYHCNKLCWGRCRVETGKSNYGHPGLKIKNYRLKLSLRDILYMCVGGSVFGGLSSGFYP